MAEVPKTDPNPKPQDPSNCTTKDPDIEFTFGELQHGVKYRLTGSMTIKGCISITGDAERAYSKKVDQHVTGQKVKIHFRDDNWVLDEELKELTYDLDLTFTAPDQTEIYLKRQNLVAPLYTTFMDRIKTFFGFFARLITKLQHRQHRAKK